jgi:sirohydrochlorin cobaltochelatase
MTSVSSSSNRSICSSDAAPCNPAETLHSAAGLDSRPDAPASGPQIARALVLFAHGARDPAWAAPLYALVQQVQQQAPRLQVRTAFLERLAPTLPAVLHELTAADDRVEISVLPVFWAEAGHVRNELPALIAAVPAARQVRVLPVLSELPGLLAAIAQAALGLVDTPSNRPARTTAPEPRVSAPAHRPPDPN